MATSRSIAWPHFGLKVWPKMGPFIYLEVFTCFLLKLSFFLKNLILPAERRKALKKKTKNYGIKVAKLLAYGGQVIDPTAYIYAYTKKNSRWIDRWIEKHSACNNFSEVFLCICCI